MDKEVKIAATVMLGLMTMATWLLGVDPTYTKTCLGLMSAVWGLPVVGETLGRIGRAFKGS